MSPDSGSEGDESDTDIQERKARDASRKKMLLGNLGAGVSRVRVASSTRDYGTYDNEDEDEDGEDAVLVGGNRDRDLEGGEDVEESRPTGGLSAKAGIILVSVFRVSGYHFSLLILRDRVSTMSSLSFHNSSSQGSRPLFSLYSIHKRVSCTVRIRVKPPALL